VASALDQLIELGEDAADVTDQGDGDLDILADGGGIDVDVDDLRPGGELAHLAGDAVIEAHADGDEEVGLLDGIVGVGGAMHAHHLESEGVGLGKGPQSHQGGGDRRLDVAGQKGQFAGGAAGDDSAAGEDDGPFGTVDAGGGFLDLGQVAGDGGLVAADAHLFRIGNGGCGLLDILGDVDEDGTGTAAAGDIKGRFEQAGQLIDLVDEEIVFGDRAGDAEHIRFLKGVVADQAGRDLAGYGHQRNGVHIGGCQSGDQIGGAGAGGRHTDPDLARGAGEAVGGMRSPLLMAGEIEGHPRRIECIKDVDHHTARISEEGAHTLLLQGVDDHLCAGHDDIPSAGGRRRQLK